MESWRGHKLYSLTGKCQTGGRTLQSDIRRKKQQRKHQNIKAHFIRVRNAGASGRECSALAGRHYLPPRQAGFTSFSTKKSNCNLLEDVASPHCAKTSLSSTLRIISSKEDGSPCLVIADEDLTLDFEAGTPGTSNHGAGVRCFISAHEKIFRIDL